MSDLIDRDLAAGVRITPVTVLTGFLGTRKTTLLNRILNGEHGLRIAVLVNDFGSINIDAALVVGVESGGDVISLANGCVCSNIRDDLLTVVCQVIDRPERPEYIVLEASGVAEPSGIAATFLDARLRDRLRLDSIMCVVDASQIFAAPEMKELKLRQIALADMLILNRTDLVSREEIGRIKAWLDEHFHRYRLIEAARGELPLEILLSAGRFDPAQLDAGASHRAEPDGERMGRSGAPHADRGRRCARRRGCRRAAQDFRSMRRRLRPRGRLAQDQSRSPPAERAARPAVSGSSIPLTPAAITQTTIGYHRPR